MKVNYRERIPNNVNLSDDRRLQRALESWQPKFLDWWRDLGPAIFQEKDVYLRTAVDVGREGWAVFDYVKLPEYRWGIFLAEPEPARRVGFGEHLGQPVWSEIPGEYRTELRRLIVIQGDTEPASVEQQRQLGRTAPSLYDLRNVFQVNVEEGRHLWAMVYLLHAHFGRDGREEAEALLERHAGDAEKPRILEAFNVETSDWLSFFMYTYFQDRDGKFQLAALRESAFDPLARTCEFMLKEEAHHMFVGATGVGRVVQRTAELMREHDTADVRPYGGVDLHTIQKYINFHFSVSLDLFGSERSTNAATYYSHSLKGRFQEPGRDDDHRLESTTYHLHRLVDGQMVIEEVPAILTVNELLRDDYIGNCQEGLDRWNQVLAEHGVSEQLRLPHRGFNRKIGAFSSRPISPDGGVLSEAEWTRRVGDWLPTEGDRAYIQSLMRPVYERGKVAGWLAPPRIGINGRPADFEYVLL